MRALLSLAQVAVAAAVVVPRGVQRDARTAPGGPHTFSAVAGRPASGAGVAQAAIVDAGGFIILRDGVRIGRESFTIRRVPPPDPGFILEGAAIYPAYRLVPALRTDTSGQPLRYQRENFAADRRQEVLTVQVNRGHGTERVQTRRGESGTEFIVGPGTRLLEDELFAQYYFVAREAVQQHSVPGAGTSRRVPVIIPGHSGAVSVTVSDVADERIDVAGQSQPAIHLRMDFAGGDSRDLWVDSQGRILRVVVPARHLTAVRNDVPP